MRHGMHAGTRPRTILHATAYSNFVKITSAAAAKGRILKNSKDGLFLKTVAKWGNRGPRIPQHKAQHLLPRIPQHKAQHLLPHGIAKHSLSGPTVRHKCVLATMTQNACGWKSVQWTRAKL